MKWTLLFGCTAENHIRVFVADGDDPSELAREILAAPHNSWMDEHYLIVAIEGEPNIRRRNENHSNDPTALWPD